jgi:spermidine/putrescine transport system ATP-binding protein
MSQTVIRNLTTSNRSTILDVELRQVVKVFSDQTVVRGIDLAIAKGEFFSILGPSGCGKTTILRLIAGFDSPTQGEILLRGQSVLNIPPHQRPVNTVFQSYALFSHLTVEENVGFGLKIKKVRRSEIQDRAREALRLVKMEDFAKRYPAQLSGGQQQRVALARALINRPMVVLLDEPLGALDLKLRKEMQFELANLHRKLGITFVLVTHDQEEALSLSDRVAVINGGQIEQIGTPSEIYNRPASRFVAEFIGDTNLINGKIEGTHPAMLWVKGDSGLKLMVHPHVGSPDSGYVAVSIRPEKIHLDLEPTDQLNCFPGILRSVMYFGTHLNCRVELRSGEWLTVRQPHGTPLPEMGTPVYVSWIPESALALPQ